MASQTSSDLFAHLCDGYAEYRQTQDLEQKGLFYTPDCHQICRPDPSYAARDRATIVRYLGESGPLVTRILRDAGHLAADEEIGSAPRTGYYTVLPLTDDEAQDFGTEKYVRPAGFASVAEVQSRAKAENWAGIKVDMWDDDGRDRGLLVRAKYWWKRDEVAGEWRQVLHDILYLGVRDGTEGAGGGVVKKDA
ncbi:hypothetical protein AK830_g2036 [Neonectria ditissima]|uniref:SnoaL-like domain-containing protein n=1 Tax=Neonectria ditissima TaxID=78410 RepID=A0A0N8H8H2_9HYPO|nr:hypothetical protein AK830_g2036 [Neonectria ditissima]